MTSRREVKWTRRGGQVTAETERHSEGDTRYRLSLSDLLNLKKEGINFRDMFENDRNEDSQCRVIGGDQVRADLGGVLQGEKSCYCEGCSGEAGFCSW